MAIDSKEWTEKKELGSHYEQRVALFYERLGMRAAIQFGQAEYDVGLAARLEVKADDIAQRTGRVAIEIFYKGRPSGITTSSADMWVICVGDIGYVIRTEDLRAFCESPATNDIRRVNGGDGGNSEMLLVRLEDIKRIKSHAIKLPELA